MNSIENDRENSPHCCIVEHWQFMFEKNLSYKLREVLIENEYLTSAKPDQVLRL